jgi:hypothetical protein
MRRSVVLFGLSISVAAATACSSSSSNNNAADSGTTPEAAASSGDGGVICSGATCAAGEVCCTARTSPTCTPAGACQGSFLTCSDTASCAGKICCFTYTDMAMTAFTTACQDTCAMPSYKLCSSDSECTGGNTCMMGQITTYCGMGGFMFDAGNGGTMDSGSTIVDSSTTQDTGSSASEAGPAADTGAE